MLDAVGLPSCASVASSTVTETADAEGGTGSADGDDAGGGEWVTPKGWIILY